ncbi:MAG: GSCFA domain-containing protein [Chitinophagaceae bacterium]|nr:GSCFA domain-containing protein [Chitinophagaceae bacterium]
MEFMTPIDIKPLPEPISYHDRILLTGSCFTEHIGQSLTDHKFTVLQNPHGILFDPASVCKSLISYVQQKEYTRDDLFLLNEVWHSWDHHSRFSHIDPQAALDAINTSQREAHQFLKEASWIIITLGSSFSYRLTAAAQGRVTADGALLHGSFAPGVANCHRAPAQWFTKHLLEIEETITLLDNCYHQLMHFNPKLRILFTISPVRHLRDGVVDNNRSKARLIEAVHHMVHKFERLHYFPAYELVIDVLRDYRFYDVDMAHPNYQATGFVMEHFAGSCIDPATRGVMEDVRKLVIARRHRAFQPATQAHQQFLRNHYEKARQLQAQHPYLNLQEELNYFSGNSDTR